MARTKRRRRRDPARPKRAMTPFLFFACEQRLVLKDRGDKMTLPEQSRHIAHQWKSVTDKSKYEALSAKDRARYNDEMSRYVPPHRIKRPRSSYAFFMRDARARISQAHPDANPRELMPFIAAEWKSISDSDKLVYTQMATDDKKRYADEKAAATPN